MISISRFIPKAAVAIVGLTTFAWPAFADLIVFDPDSGGNATKVSIGSLQFGAGNSLAFAAAPFTTGKAFQLLMQAQLNSVVTDTGIQVTPDGLNAAGTVSGVAPYEITVVLSATEISGKTATNFSRFELFTTQTGGFVEVYYDPNHNANALAGTGYNDGLLILRATPQPSRANGGVFSAANPQPTTAPSFDKFGTNNYATSGPGGTNITSVLGTGGTKFDAQITYVNPGFFVAPGGGDAGRQLAVGDIITFEIGQGTPFDKVEPSHLFDGVPNTGTDSGPAPTVTATLGANNGLSGPDMQLQSVATASFASSSATPIPTPSATPTPTVTPTPTPTPTPTATPTPTPSSSPVVSVSSDKTSVREGHDAVITFTVNPTAHPAITVNYSNLGTATLNTDYTVSGTPGQVAIPANQGSAIVTLHAVTDSVKDGGETARFFVGAGAGYQAAPAPADKVGVTILDPP